MNREHGKQVQGSDGYGEVQEAQRLLGYRRLLEAVLEREADEWSRQQEETGVMVLDLPEHLRIEASSFQR